MANILNPVDFVNAGNPYPTGLRYILVTGGPADTELIVEVDVTPEDKVVYALYLQTKVISASIVLNDITANVSIPADNRVIISNINTTDGYIWFCYYDMR